MASNSDKTPIDQLNEAIISYDADAVAHATKALVTATKSSPLDPDAVILALKQATAMGNYRLVETLSEQYAKRLRLKMVNYPKTFAPELVRAVDTFDKVRATELCQQLILFHQSAADPYPLSVQNHILYTLQRKRYFDLMIQVADTLIMRNGAIDKTDNDAARNGKLKVRRKYAQALIDIGQLSAALDVLTALERDCQTHGVVKELAEAQGLIGRIRKQFYMNFTSQSNHEKPTKQHQQSLADAITAYSSPYDSDNQENNWHGINLVALLKRAGRDKVPLTGKNLDWKNTARSILSHIAKKLENKDPKERTKLWDFATAVEANLALGKYDEALKWLAKYTDDNTSGANAFEYASTLRQFEEVWQLDETKKSQAKILQLLRSALLRKEGGTIEIHDPVQEVKMAEQLVTDAQFEKVLGQDRYKTYFWYVTGLERATAVAKIYDRVDNGVGTGFLVKGSDIHPSISQDWVFITNAHVISDDPLEQNRSSDDPKALAPEDATIIFQAGSDAGKKFTVDQLIFTSPRTELDCSIVSLTQPLSFDKPYRIAQSLPMIHPEKDHRVRVYIIGHPKGGKLAFSLHDNALLDHQMPKVHYRAPTEGGSSGSPVFNANWDLIALHHMGGESIKKLNNKPGFYDANEGISIKNIREAVAQVLD